MVHGRGFNLRQAALADYEKTYLRRLESIDTSWKPYGAQFHNDLRRCKSLVLALLKQHLTELTCSCTAAISQSASDACELFSTDNVGYAVLLMQYSVVSRHAKIRVYLSPLLQFSQGMFSAARSLG